MGMRSSFDSEEVKVTNVELLKGVIKKYHSWLGLFNLKEYTFDMNNEEVKKLEVVDDLEKVFTFECFDDCKIQGYWYSDFSKMLLELASCVDGWVKLIYEEGQPYVINFAGGKGDVHVDYVPLQWLRMDKKEVIENAELTTEERMAYEVTE